MRGVNVPATRKALEKYLLDERELHMHFHATGGVRRWTLILATTKLCDDHERCMRVVL